MTRSDRGGRARPFLALALLATLQLGARIELAADVWPPFTDVEGGHRVALDLVEAALERAGIEAEVQIRSRFGTILSDLKSGDLDGGAALWRDADRETYLLFSRPYLENRLVLLGLEGADVSARSLFELHGKRVAIVEGYSYGGMLDVGGGPTFVRGSSEQANFERLLEGRVDYLLTDELLIHDLFERDGARAERMLEVGEVPLLERSLHLAIRRGREDAEDLIRRFESALQELIVDGSYNRLLGVAWIEADIDGDGRPEMVLGGTSAGAEEPDDGYVVFRPEGSDSGPREPGSRRYVIEGRTYPNWNSVPVEYRSREVRADAEIPRVPIFTW